MMQACDGEMLAFAKPVRHNVSMNRLSTQQRSRIVAALVEGNSIRATCRMTGASKNTVTKLLVDLGVVCSAYQDRVMRDLTCERIQCDEIWSFCYSKQKNIPADMRSEEGVGDVWTWVALDADTKLVPTYRVGARDVGEAQAFLADLAPRLRNRPQVTTDGLGAYYLAVPRAFEGKVDFAQMIKHFGVPADAERRYSPAVCTGVEKRTVHGDPNMGHVSTSYVERQNLTMRMGMRRFTRLTNAFSKKIENHAAAISLHFMHYNFCRVHKTLKTTPAVAAGITDHVWGIEEIIGLLEEAEAVPVKRGRYAKTREVRAELRGETSE
jgi:IS1 family transposase